MHLNLAFHIDFDGRCEEAFQFYTESLGGVIGSTFRYIDSPMVDKLIEEWHQKIVHADITIGNIQLTGADVSKENYKTPQGFNLLLGLKSESEVKEKFSLLELHGKVVFPPQKTFWSPCYSIVVDRFGIPWKLNCGT